MKGRLYIHFNVEFPESGVLSPEQCRSLEKILPPPKTESSLTAMDIDECEETILHDVNMEEENRRQQQQQRQRRREAYEDDDDDEDDSSMPRVQCAQQ